MKLSYPHVDLARHFGATDFVNPKDIKEPVRSLIKRTLLIQWLFQLQQYLVEKFDNGFDYTFECVGNVEVMVNRTGLPIIVYRPSFPSVQHWNVLIKVNKNLSVFR